MTAVQQNGQALQYASNELKNDRGIALIAVQKDACALADLSSGPRNDREIVLTAVRQNGQALRYASNELRSDREVVATAVQQNWRAFEYASYALKKDPALADMVKQEEQRQSSMNTQALNFLWLGLDLPAKPDPEDGSIRLPLPEEYIGNVREAGRRHPHADVHLWVDSRRLTAKQLDYLEAVVEDEMPNVHLKDLCSIPGVAQMKSFYSRPETRKNWRSGRAIRASSGFRSMPRRS